MDFGGERCLKDDRGPICNITRKLAQLGTWGERGSWELGLVQGLGSPPAPDDVCKIHPIALPAGGVELPELDPSLLAPPPGA